MIGLCIQNYKYESFGSSVFTLPNNAMPTPMYTLWKQLVRFVGTPCTIWTKLYLYFLLNRLVYNTYINRSVNLLSDCTSVYETLGVTVKNWKYANYVRGAYFGSLKRFLEIEILEPIIHLKLKINNWKMADENILFEVIC